MQMPQIPRRLFTVHEVAGMLALSRATVYELIASGELRGLKIGRATRIAEEDINNFISRLQNRCD
jgi:excisionase family DNA binding protein